MNDRNNNKKYTCVVRTYIIDEPEAGYVIEDYYNVFDTNEMGADSSILYGNDVIEIDYFENDTQREALREYIKLLQCFGSEYRKAVA